MQDRAHTGPVDYQRLGEYLRVLSVPTRIQLLHKLQTPQTAAEIRLAAFRQDADANPTRAISRQAVEGHLKKLEAIGLVRWRPAKRSGQDAKEYFVNHPRLFVVADEMRRLSLIRPAMSAVAQETRLALGSQDQPPPAHRLPDGPSLVFAAGPLEGTAAPLSGRGPWSIGRDPGNAVAVDHDPFVSGRNAEVFRDGDGWFLLDLAGDRNGTTHNWRPLGGATVALAAGDTIGVGRSLLLARGL